MGCNGQVAGQKRMRWAISDDSRPIHMKEASDSYWALMAVKDTLKIHRAVTYVDNTTLVRISENSEERTLVSIE